MAAVAVRVEDATSIGRSYTDATALTRNVKPGLGAERASLHTRSFDPYSSGEKPILESATLGLIHLERCTRDDVLAYFRNTWGITTALFSGLRDDSVFYAVPDKLRRPLIFYFCHPAALYVNKMHQAGLVDAVDPYLQKLFETGVDEMSWDDMDVMQEPDFAWPSVSEAVAFRELVRVEVERAIMEQFPAPATTGQPITWDSPWWSLFLGFEHERIHIETSSVLIHQLPIDFVHPPPGWRTAPTDAHVPSDAPVNRLVPVAESTVVLGKPRDFPSFGFDNEYGKRVVNVPAFSGAQYKVSNAEFLPFVLAGGYEQRQWWVSPSGDDEGWRWRTYRNATHPSFWVADASAEMARFVGGTAIQAYQKDDAHPRAGTAGVFKLRTVFDIIDMPWDWPVEANYHEAAAFIRWKNAQLAANASNCDTIILRLPTEAEFHAMRAEPSPYAEQPRVLSNTSGTKVVVKPKYEGKVWVPEDTVTETTYVGAEVAKWGEDTTNGMSGGAPYGSRAGTFDVMLRLAAPGNVNLRWHSSTPVNAYAPSAAGFYDTHGNVWEWGEDHFAPLPGFEIHYLYDDFSTPCFDGWHTLILGSAWVSTGDLGSSFARYHFRRHFFQHCGFRYVTAQRGETYPGAGTVANLWEGTGAAIARDIADAYATVSDRLPYPPASITVEAGARYPRALADAVAAAYGDALSAAGSNKSDSSRLPPLSCARVLHLGCGVGGGSFALISAGFGAVTGVDIREEAIRHARVLQHHGQFELDAPDEGVLTRKLLVTAGVPPSGRTRVSFVRGDAAALPTEVMENGPFDVVLVDGLLTRLEQPLHLLRALREYVRPNGLLIISSNNDWSPEHTPRNSWIGGFKMNGEEQRTLSMLRYHLKRNFGLLQALDLPRLTRQHARRFTLDVRAVTLWLRHSCSTESDLTPPAVPQD